MPTFNRDCRSFPGTHACDIMTAEGYEDCKDCPYYDKISKKILILKLGAMGDIIRTTPLLSALKKAYGIDTHITWVVNEESKDLLKHNPYLDKVLAYTYETTLRLQQEHYDLLLSLEVAPPATLLANLINATEKLGYHLNKDGHPAAYNQEAEPYLHTVFSNTINKKTRKTYQQTIFEITRLHYEHQEYILPLEDHEKNYAKQLLNHQGEKLIGINVGAAERWQSKSWHPTKIIELTKKIIKQTNYNVILLGGKKEETLKHHIKQELKKTNIHIKENDSNNTIREYMSIINLCEKIVTPDSLALHIAIGLKKRTIALFFCTPPWQIDTYHGLLTPITSPLLDQYFMDDQYHEDLITSISADEVFQKLIP